MDNLRITLVQTDLFWEQPQKNRIHFSKILGGISEETDLIVLPEMFTTGFSMEPKEIAEENAGITLKWMKDIARSKNSALTGSIIVKENEMYFNRLFFVLPDGEYYSYDKRHLFGYAGEHHKYTAGSEKLIISYKNWRICPLICYDLRFPVWARNTNAYDVLIYIANWPQSRILHWDTLLRARSIENQCYTVGVSRIGKDPNQNDYNGHSAVYDPMGALISTSDYEKEFVQTLVVKKSDLEEIRGRYPFLKDRDDFQVFTK